MDQASLSIGAVGTANILDGAVSNAKLAVLTSPGLVQNAATTATSANVPDAIVARDGAGDFTARAAELEEVRLSGPATLGTRLSLDGAALLRASSTATYLGSGAGANATGSSVVGIGAGAAASATGTGSVAVGFGAGAGITSGARNTGIGMGALGGGALTGDGNVAIGANALGALSGTAVGNIAIGTSAGGFLSSGSYNIYLSHDGEEESNTIRIGHPSVQSRAFLAGVRGVITGLADAVPVLIDSRGQLGTISSSARFKHDVTALTPYAAAIHALRPVAFRYLPELDSSQTISFGLIAEEVATVLPELVARGADGQIETVKYHLLAPLLLSEIQRLRLDLDAATAREVELADRLGRLEARLDALAGGSENVHTNGSEHGTTGVTGIRETR